MPFIAGGAVLLALLAGLGLCFYYRRSGRFAPRDFSENPSSDFVGRAVSVAPAAPRFGMLPAEEGGGGRSSEYSASGRQRSFDVPTNAGLLSSTHSREAG